MAFPAAGLLLRRLFRSLRSTACPNHPVAAGGAALPMSHPCLDIAVGHRSNFMEEKSVRLN
jgi:hypothetical protein